MKDPNLKMIDEFDRYIGNCMKNWAAGQAPASNRRQKLLGMAASEDYPLSTPLSWPYNHNMVVPKEFFDAARYDTTRQFFMMWGFPMPVPVIRMI
jgi:hypothetical protein